MHLFISFIKPRSYLPTEFPFFSKSFILSARYATLTSACVTAAGHFDDCHIIGSRRHHLNHSYYAVALALCTSQLLVGGNEQL